jgi:uncharacterized sulfatase
LIAIGPGEAGNISINPMRLLLACCLLGFSPAAAVAAEKPNVLFLVVDDLNIDLGTFGHAIVRTPNVDRLKARGIKFDRAYSQFPLCSPSRQSFLSGLRPETSGAIAQALTVRRSRPDWFYLPGWFRQHGYQVSGVGKVFHGKDDASWDRYTSGDSASPQEQAALKARAAVRDRGEHGPEWTPLDDPEESTGDAIVARTAAGYLREAARQSRPFFVAAGFRKPHLPWTAPRRYFDLYPKSSIPPLVEPALDGIPAIALQTDLTGRVPPGQEGQARAAYYACVTFVDTQIGRILATMDELKLWERTIVVLLSDHGFHLGDHGLWGKLTNFERSARVPLLVAPPRSPHAGTATRAIVELLDLYPTLVDLCGLPVPHGLEGRSLRPVLASPGRPWPHAAYSCTIHQGVIGRSVRTDRWRYTEWGDGTAAELYDHAADPGEYRNLAATPARTADVASLKILLAVPPRVTQVPVDAQTERKGRKK